MTPTAIPIIAVLDMELEVFAVFETLVADGMAEVEESIEVLEVVCAVVLAIVVAAAEALEVAVVEGRMLNPFMNIPYTIVL